MIAAADPATADPLPEVGPYLTKQMLAARLHVSDRTIDYWLRDKPQFPRPYFRMGRRSLWRMSDVASYERRLAEGDPHAA
jgi:predicted DNA-binding transcriptional regulator AlpA